MSKGLHSLPLQWQSGESKLQNRGPVWHPSQNSEENGSYKVSFPVINWYKSFRGCCMFHVDEYWMGREWQCRGLSEGDLGWGKEKFGRLRCLPSGLHSDPLQPPPPPFGSQMTMWGGFRFVGVGHSGRNHWGVGGRGGGIIHSAINSQCILTSPMWPCVCSPLSAFLLIWIMQWVLKCGGLSASL